MSKIIEVEHLKKYFKEVKAVDDISFYVEKGELFGFLGVNGAGKTTKISMLCTLFPQSDGEARICGYRLGKENEAIRKSIGVVYQNNCLDECLSVKENLMVRGVLYEKNSATVRKNMEQVIELLSLQDVLERKFRNLSGGQKRRCEIARALMNQPEILFLDEPTTGLDPATRKSVWECIAHLQKEMGMTFFLTTHYMEEAAKAANIAIMDAGKIREYGTPFQLKEKFACDKLRVIPRESDIDLIGKFFHDSKFPFKRKNDYFAVQIPDTMAAFAILQEIRHQVKGFEVLQGTMDDVFLNVTGKSLEA